MAREQLRRIARAIAPPIVVRGVRTLRARVAPEWTYLPDGWPTRTDELGWEHPEIAEVSRRRWEGFRRTIEAPQPLGHSNEAPVGVANYAVHNTFLSFGYVVARAANSRSHLSILDWGGGLGEYLLLAESLFPDLSIAYTCKERAPMVSAGKRLLPRASFASDTLEATSAPYDLVMASGSLHYEEVWRPTFKVLASTAHPWFYVTRLPIVHHADDFVVTQRAHAYGYPTAYPGWILNREHFLQLATGCSLSLEREFLIDERPTVPGAPEQPEYRGFLFRRDDAQ